MGRKARCYLLSTVSALTLSSAASAQGNWAGAYIGGHGGIAWLQHSQSYTSTVNIFTCSQVPLTKCKLDDTGAVLGAQAGYNWQQQQWVFGIESDLSWTSLKKTVTTFPLAPSTFFHSIHDRVDWLASVRGRVGWAAGDMLFYATAGVAFANFNAGWFRDGSIVRDQIDKTKTGWVAGGGIEKMFNRNWSARAEFLHYGFGRTTHSATFFGGNTYTTAFRHDVSVVRLGINFRP
jgi:outer membrane immunogenic protein